MSTEKTFTRRELLDALLSVGDDGDPYKFEPDGIWLDSPRSDWHSLTPQEQEDIAGFDSATAKDHPRDPDRLLVGRPPAPGDMLPLPLLPFPFTCVELLEFEDATGNELRSRLPADDGEALKRAGHLRQPQDPRREVKPNAADIVRLLIGDLRPEDMEPDGDEDAQAAQAEASAGTAKRAALVARLEHEWPTIEADLNEASRNGLGKAARAGTRGFWRVEKAREWAQQRGKLRQQASVRPLNSPWPGAVRKHRMEV
ncbi:MAG TPA: hypothetical protein PKA16_02255 [Ottowia sp.]|uniref:hypothetical protein n=1 Tax=Ottowia sp. TaxID=1898956 RepID=UPI002CB7F014|nr:hypothetical protein [Ottowia sp.]HMN20194.1 hypothetical protein [Ottowia sp.]